MYDNLKTKFKEAEYYLLNKDNRALSIYESIVEEKVAEELFFQEIELSKIFAFSYARIFLLTGLNRYECLEAAIEYFEIYLEKVYLDKEAQELYITILELSYQYEKSYILLKKMLNHEKLKSLALTFLSSYSYVGDKMESFEEMLCFKKQLIEVENDVNEKEKLQKELEKMMKEH